MSTARCPGGGADSAVSSSSEAIRMRMMVEIFKPGISLLSSEVEEDARRDDADMAKSGWTTINVDSCGER